jgi:hypothetical protein
MLHIAVEGVLVFHIEGFIARFLSYLFQTRREAVEELAPKTHLSPREAELFLLRKAGFDDETNAAFMGITSSNLTTFSNRIEDRIREAKMAREEAKETLQVLQGTWVDGKA